MTPQEIAARLPELTGGPHDDDTITALAQITAEEVRAVAAARLRPDNRAVLVYEPVTLKDAAGTAAGQPSGDGSEQEGAGR